MTNQDWIDVILIMIYTRYRISEVLNIRKSDIDFINGVIKGGGKTSKGKNRIIPIMEKIRELVIKRYDDSKTEYLIDYRNWKIKADKMNTKPLRENYFRNKFYEIMEQLGMNHKPQDTRKTLATLLSKEGMSESIITDLMGHTDIKVTEKYYIHNDIDTLKKAMKKINDIN